MDRIQIAPFRNRDLILVNSATPSRRAMLPQRHAHRLNVMLSEAFDSRPPQVVPGFTWQAAQMKRGLLDGLGPAPQAEQRVERLDGPGLVQGIEVPRPHEMIESLVRAAEATQGDGQTEVGPGPTRSRLHDTLEIVQPPLGVQLDKRGIFTASEPCLR